MRWSTARSSTRGFTAYESALDHAVDAWSPARGFAIAFREATPAGDAVPEEANLIYRDVEIPGSAFKGVTVTWAHAPTTITLNRSTLPPPETTDPLAAGADPSRGHPRDRARAGVGRRADARRQHPRMREHAHEAECRQGRGTLHRAATGRCRPLLHAVGWNHLRQSSDADRHARRAPRAGLGAARGRVASPARRGPAHDRVSLSGRDLRADPAGGHHARAGRERQPAHGPRELLRPRAGRRCVPRPPGGWRHGSWR